MSTHLSLVIFGVLAAAFYGYVHLPVVHAQSVHIVSPLPTHPEGPVITVGASPTPAMPNTSSLLTETVVTTPRWAAFIKSARKVADIYNFPVNVVVAQAALESARGTSAFAATRNNYIGIGAVDSNPNSAFRFENQEQCLIEYMRTIRHNFPEAWASRKNPEKLLQLLEENSRGNYYASDPDYVSKVMAQPEWEAVK